MVRDIAAKVPLPIRHQIVVDELDRQIINELQEGFLISDSPYAEIAEKLATTETELLGQKGSSRTPSSAINLAG